MGSEASGSALETGGIPGRVSPSSLRNWPSSRLPKTWSGGTSGANWTSQSTSRTTAAATTRIRVKVYFPTGISEKVKVNGTWRYKARSVTLRIRYRASGNTGAGTDIQWAQKGEDDTNPMTKEYEWDLSAAGTWELAISATDFSDGRKSSDLKWTRLESKAPSKAGLLLGMAALCIQGDPALFGNDIYLKGLSAGLAAELKETVGGAVVAPTRSPAAAFIDVLQGMDNPRAVADARMHSTSIAAWAADCATRGATFDFTFGEGGGAGTVADALRMICAAGRASFGLIDGKYGVIMEPAAGATPTLFFCPRTISGFRPVRGFTLQPHAVRVSYEKAVLAYTYRPPGASADLSAYRYKRETTIVYAPGYTAATASIFESWTIDGVTTEQQAVANVYYLLSVLAARIRTYEFTMDAAHLRATRGDVALGAHDVPGWGASWGRVKAVLSATQLRLDERVVMVGAGTYEITAVRADGTYAVVAVTTAAGESDTFSTTAPHGAAVGDLVFFGTTGASTKSCVVLKVDPADELSAHVTVAELGSGLSSPGSGSTTAGAISAAATVLDKPVVESVNLSGAIKLMLGGF